MIVVLKRKYLRINSILIIDLKGTVKINRMSKIVEKQVMKVQKKISNYMCRK